MEKLSDLMAKVRPRVRRAELRSALGLRCRPLQFCAMAILAMLGHGQDARGTEFTAGTTEFP